MAMLSCSEDTADDGAGSTSTTGDTTGVAHADVACGAQLVCSDGDVCVVDVAETPCTNVQSFDETCPDGDEPTACGGPGLPCCCGSAPPPQYRCFTPTECVGPPACECLGSTLCAQDAGCSRYAADPDFVFRCDPLPDV